MGNTRVKRVRSRSTRQLSDRQCSRTYHRVRFFFQNSHLPVFFFFFVVATSCESSSQHREQVEHASPSPWQVVLREGFPSAYTHKKRVCEAAFSLPRFVTRNLAKSRTFLRKIWKIWNLESLKIRERKREFLRIWRTCWIWRIGRSGQLRWHQSVLSLSIEFILLRAYVSSWKKIIIVSLK